MFKEDLWCGYCGNKDFIETPNPSNPCNRTWSYWECSWCHAVFRLNPGYGYFTTSPGENGYDEEAKFCLNSGGIVDKTKLPRTPKGIVRHSGSKEELEAYLARTQVQ